MVEYYHATLLGSPEALGYLRSRRVDDPEAIEVFKLGHADRTLSYRLPTKERKDGAELRGRLQRLGVFRPSGHEHFNGCVVVPITDSTGDRGRGLRPQARLGPPHRPARPPLPARPAQRRVERRRRSPVGEVIVCESLIDALSFWCAGYRNVTAAYGTAGFTDDHRAAFARHKVSRVLIAYDHDDAGDAAAEQAGRRAHRARHRVPAGGLPLGRRRQRRRRRRPTTRHRELGRYLAEARWLGGARPTVQDVQQKVFRSFGDGGERAPASEPLAFRLWSLPMTSW